MKNFRSTLLALSFVLSTTGIYLFLASFLFTLKWYYAVFTLIIPFFGFVASGLLIFGGLKIYWLYLSRLGLAQEKKRGYLKTYLIVIGIIIISLVVADMLYKRSNSNWLQHIGGTSWIGSKTKIYYVDRGGRLNSINLDGTEPKTIIELPLKPTYFTAKPSFFYKVDPDRKNLFVQSEDTLYLVSLETGNAEMLSQTCGICKWSGDGRYIVCGGDKKRTIDKYVSIPENFYLVDMVTSQRRKITDVPEGVVEAMIGWFKNGKEIYIVYKFHDNANVIHQFFRYNLQAGTIEEAGEKFILPRNESGYAVKLREKFDAVFPKTLVYSYYMTDSPDEYVFEYMRPHLIDNMPKGSPYKVTIKDGVSIITTGKNGKKTKAFTDANYRPSLKGDFWPIYWLPDSPYLIFTYPMTMDFAWNNRCNIYIIDMDNNKIGRLADGFFLCWSL